LSEPHTKLVQHLEKLSFFDPAALCPRAEYIHLGDLVRADGSGGLSALVDEVVGKALDERPAVIVVDSAKMLRDLARPQERRTALYDLTSRVAHAGTVLLPFGEYTDHEIASGVEFSLADGIVQLSYESREPVDRRWMRVLKMRGGSHREGKHTFRILQDGLNVYPRIESLDPLEALPLSGRISTGIPGLDPLMGGGPPRGDATLVLGPSGAGKTILSLRHVADGLAAGQRCLYITFQDTADQLVGMAGGFGWDFHGPREAGRLTISHVPMGSLDLDVLASVIRHELSDQPVGRVVIDSLAEMVSASREADRFPAYLRSLTGLIRAAGSSLLLTSETSTLGPSKEAPLDGLMFLFHNVVQLRYLERDSRVDRAVNIVKMRNSKHETGLYLCEITARGLIVGERLDSVSGRLGWSALRMQAEP